MPRNMLLPETPNSNQWHSRYVNSCECHRMKIKIIYLADNGFTHHTGSCVIIPRQRNVDNLHSPEDNSATDFVLYIEE
jgi:hypothetical protein